MVVLRDLDVGSVSQPGAQLAGHEQAHAVVRQQRVA
jgi:hypothetical protein